MSFSITNLELENGQNPPDQSSIAITYSTLMVRDLQGKTISHNAGNTKKVSLSELKKAFLTGATIKDGLSAVSIYLKNRENNSRELVATVEQDGRQFEIVARKNAVLETLTGVNLDFPTSELYLDDKPESLLEILL